MYEDSKRGDSFGTGFSFIQTDDIYSKTHKAQFSQAKDRCDTVVHWLSKLGVHDFSAEIN